MMRNINWYYHKKLDEFYQFHADPKTSIILSDSLSTASDIQQVLHDLRRRCNRGTRIFVNTHNFLWKPFLRLTELFGLKNPQKVNNWLTISDIKNVFILEGYDVIDTGRRILMPVYLPVISEIINRFIAHIPVVNSLCFMQYVVARIEPQPTKDMTVSIIIPVRNEAGNLKLLINAIPVFGAHQELIFVEGHSRDDSWKRLKDLKKMYTSRDIFLLKQKGIGKADAMRLGFSKATGEVFMVLDADMSVDPSDLTKFYTAAISGKGEFINGSRLVYPVEKEAMRFLNILGNQFFSVVLSWIINQHIKDTLCGTKVLTKINYGKIVRNRTFFGDFDPFGDFDLLFGAAKLHLKIIEIPVRYHARQYGTTNISRFRHGLLLLKMTAFALFKMKFI